MSISGRGSPGVQRMPGNVPQSVSRWRSFAERYVLSRAEKFEPGKEKEQAWQALQDAKKVYVMIAQATDPDALAMSDYPDMPPAQQAPADRSPLAQRGGGVGMAGPLSPNSAYSAIKKGQINGTP